MVSADSGAAEDRGQLVKQLALAAGFDLVGIAPIAPAGHGEVYRQWIAGGQQGEMHYLERQVEERLDLRQKWPWAKSALVVALAYFQEVEGAACDESWEGGSGVNLAPQAQRGLCPTGPGTLGTHADLVPITGRIARYAWGRDYHRIMDSRLRRLEKLIRERLTPEAFEVRACCDTAPVLERELAARAGLGWVGKNTLLIHPRHGSWFVLGELITSLELIAVRGPLPDGRGSDLPADVTEHCGTCRRCIEACPTGAITPWQVAARKCLSYLTLEHRGAIPVEYEKPLAESGFIVGCDICQEVCPFNHQPLPLSAPDFKIQAPAPALELSTVGQWTELDWDRATRGRAHRRARFAMWQRNAAILEGKGSPDNARPPGPDIPAETTPLPPTP